MLILTNTGFKRIITIVIFLLIPGIHIAQNNVRTTSKNPPSTSSDSTQTSRNIARNIDSTRINTSDTTLSALDSLRVVFFKGSIENRKLNRYNYIDTNTYHFQQFDPLYINNGLYSTLSNIGMAAKNLVYTPTLSTGYFMGSSSFTKYLYQNKMLNITTQLFLTQSSDM